MFNRAETFRIEKKEKYRSEKRYANRKSYH